MLRGGGRSWRMWLWFHGFFPWAGAARLFLLEVFSARGAVRVRSQGFPDSAVCAAVDGQKHALII